MCHRSPPFVVVVANDAPSAISPLGCPKNRSRSPQPTQQPATIAHLIQIRSLTWKTSSAVAHRGGRFYFDQKTGAFRFHGHADTDGTIFEIIEASVSGQLPDGRSGRQAIPLTVRASLAEL